MEFDDDSMAFEGSFWEPDEPRAVVRRVWCGLAIVAVSMVTVALAVFEQRDAVGVAIGAGLISLSFWFLQSSLRSLLLSGDDRPPSGTVFMFVGRWVLIAVIGYAAYKSGWASGGGILTGTFALLGAIVFEAVFQAVWGFKSLGGPKS